MNKHKQKIYNQISGGTLKALDHSGDNIPLNAGFPEMDQGYVKLKAFIKCEKCWRDCPDDQSRLHSGHFSPMC